MNARSVLFAGCALCALFFAVPAGAVAAAPQTQRAMDANAGTAFAAADHELNQVYQQVLKKHADDPVFVAKFKAAQRAWIAFRDAEVAARYPAKDPAMEYGSSYPMCLADLKTRLTMNRIKELRQWLNGAQEGDVCAGSLGTGGN